MGTRFRQYADFWPYYLREHSRAGTRALHYLGTALAVVLIVAAIFSGDWRLFLVAVFVGYGLAWIGHFFIERNRPATFQHPFWSLFSDFRMAALWLSGRLGAELDRHGIDAGRPPNGNI